MALLSISHNPHSERPQDLWDELSKQANPDEYDYIGNEIIDRDGLERLKGLLGANG